MKREIEQKDYKIQDGDAGIYETVGYMWHYALRDTKEAAIRRLVRDLRGKSDLETLKNIFN